MHIQWSGIETFISSLTLLLIIFAPSTKLYHTCNRYFEIGRIVTKSPQLAKIIYLGLATQIFTKGLFHILYYVAHYAISEEYTEAILTGNNFT